MHLYHNGVNHAAARLQTFRNEVYKNAVLDRKIQRPRNCTPFHFCPYCRPCPPYCPPFRRPCLSCRPHCRHSYRPRRRAHYPYYPRRPCCGNAHY
nr:MAG TPA: hypothetical protein [Caudoviricetes sp.]